METARQLLATGSTIAGAVQTLERLQAAVAAVDPELAAGLEVVEGLDGVPVLGG